jgi:hypothetical protein
MYLSLPGRSEGEMWLRPKPPVSTGILASGGIVESRRGLVDIIKRNLPMERDRERRLESHSRLLKLKPTLAPFAYTQAAFGDGQHQE